jgi:ABC-type microcin C transport system duplicated ATPase subunit YejF
MPEEAERRWSIFPPSLSGERCTGGAGLDSGRTIALGIRRSGTAPVWFPRKSSLLRRTIGHVKAVTDVSFVIPTGKTVGLVGESSSGKTTVGMAMMNLVSATEGNILFRHVRIREKAWSCRCRCHW